MRWKPRTKVMFRQREGETTAIFPREFDSLRMGRVFVKSYTLAGGYGVVDLPIFVKASRPATPEEYAPLMAELEGMGYAIAVVPRPSPADKKALLAEVGKHLDSILDKEKQNGR